jgi:hypothetical protein
MGMMKMGITNTRMKAEKMERSGSGAGGMTEGTKGNGGSGHG